MAIDVHFFNRLFAIEKLISVSAFSSKIIKGIFQPFELGGVTRLIRSKILEGRQFKIFFLMIQTHERSLKQISAA